MPNAIALDLNHCSYTTSASSARTFGSTVRPTVAHGVITPDLSVPQHPPAGSSVRLMCGVRHETGSGFLCGAFGGKASKASVTN